MNCNCFVFFYIHFCLKKNTCFKKTGLPKQAVTVLPTRLVFDQISITGSAGGSVADLRATLEVCFQFSKCVHRNNMIYFLF